MRRVLEADLDGYRFVEAGTDRFRSDSAALVRDDLAASPDQLSVSRFEHYPIVRLDHAGAQLELIGIHPLSPISGSRSAARDAAVQR